MIGFAHLDGRLASLLKVPWVTRLFGCVKNKERSVTLNQVLNMVSIPAIDI